MAAGQKEFVLFDPSHTHEMGTVSPLSAIFPHGRNPHERFVRSVLRWSDELRSDSCGQELEADGALLSIKPENLIPRARL